MNNVNDDPATSTDVAPPVQAPKLDRRRRSVPELAALVLVLVGLAVYFALTSPVFLNPSNLVNIVNQMAILGIIAIPGTLLLIAGQVDLAVGSGVAFTGMVLAYAYTTTGSLPLALLLSILSGVLVGALNGFVRVVVGVNSLITTLGSLSVFRGLTQLITGNQLEPMANFSALGTAQLAFIPIPVYIFVAVIVLGWVVTRYTVFGRQLYAVGSNPIAARLVGIRSRIVVFVMFVVSGLAMTLGGMIQTSQLSSASPVAATGLELTVVTAVVLGGASLSGGQGTIGGTVLGVLILGVLQDGLTLNNVPSAWQTVAQGALLIIAVSFDEIRRRLRSSRA